ncbi:hypothetical protein CHS0354_032985 [Potamilus streckersoni]|uniref:EXPERA domain-containing protein n=1 Tax=Potamilus streckersoni TaxID=2493646 RepID=A0AAE0RX74_9BIVA|nr:hypothetical protein CHS0354_032985 [Potamilus streckersoni]
MVISRDHPYFPRELNIPNYIPNSSSIVELLGIFFGLAAVVLLGTWVYTTRRKFPITDRLKLCWFVMCGFIHLILEGYFSLFHASLAGKSSYLAQMWKEYGKGDSRYITSETFIVCMESITAFIDGPLCFLTAAAFLSRRPSPYRYVLQLSVSLCQLYGDTLYYLTEIKEGFKNGEMWHPLHFWFYFVFLNAFWIIIPLIMILQAVRNLVEAQSKLDPNDSSKQRKKAF